MNLTEKEIDFLAEKFRASASGTHKHKCGSCATVWEHSNECAGNLKAHTCPKCGAEQWIRHRE